MSALARPREALLALVEALGCRDNALRRDECGDWCISGAIRLDLRSRGHA